MLQRSTAALAHHVIRRQLEKQNRIVSAALAAKRAGLLQRPDGTGIVQMTETRIYIGLNDAETRTQKAPTEECLELVKSVCRKHHAAFSVDIEEGGYYHEDGEYTEETSLVLVLIDTDREVVRKIAGDLRTALHQESVLVTEDLIRGCLIGEDPEMP
jgi:hypothetical protein